MVEFEVELRRGNWIARLRGNENEVKHDGRNLSVILDELAGTSLGKEQLVRHESSALEIAARNISKIGLPHAVLLVLAYANRPLTKSDLSEKLKQLGKQFSPSTVEYKTVPSMCKEGLLHFTEPKREGLQGQPLRNYFLTERGKIEAERIVNEFSSDGS